MVVSKCAHCAVDGGVECDVCGSFFFKQHVVNTHALGGHHCPACLTASGHRPVFSEEYRAMVIVVDYINAKRRRVRS